MCSLLGVPRTSGLGNSLILEGKELYLKTKKKAYLAFKQIKWISHYNFTNLKSVSCFVSSVELCKSEYLWHSRVEVLQCGLSRNWPRKTIKQSNKALWWILALRPWLDAIRMSSGISILALLVFGITVFKN